MANINLTAGQNITLEQDGNNLIINGEAGGGASSDIVIISDEQPTSEDNKIWIDTGEVQNLGSEVHIGSEIDSKIGLNILVGKNLFDKNNFNVLDALISDGGTLASNQYFKTLFIQCNPNTTYTISKISSSYFRVGGFASVPTLGASYISRIKDDNATSITYTTPSNCNYLAITYYDSNSDNNLQAILNSIQIEKGSTATTYQAYITPTINVDGEDIYVKGQNEVYSTKEQRIGTWIDGKPLYRKCLQFNTPNSTTNTQVATFDTTYTIRNYYGNVTISASNQLIPLNFYFTNEYNVTTYVTNVTGTINMKIGIASYQKQPVTMFIEYTKTTD